MGCCGSTPASAIQPIKGERAVETKFEGPIGNRVCRDVFFLLLFIAFLGGLGYVFYYALGKGNPYLLVYGTDSYGNVCNQKNSPIPGAPKSGRDTTGLTQLFYFDEDFLQKAMTSVTVKVDSVAVCVRMCPNETLADVTAFQNFYNTFQSSVCNYDVIPASYAADGSTCPQGPVSVHYTKFNRCIPDSLRLLLDRFGDALSSILELFDDNFGEKCAQDLGNSWKDMIYMALAGLGVSVLLLVLLRFVVGIMVWTTVALVALGCLAGTGFCWYSYCTQLTDAWLYGSIAASIFTVIVLLILLVMRKRIGLVVQLFKEAGKAVGRMPQLLIQPFVVLVITGGALAAFGYLFLYIVTARNPVVDDTTGFVSFEEDNTMKGLVVYYLLGFIWVTQFIAGCERFTISSAVALWYFTRDKTRLSSPVSRSIWRLIRYHMGSIAFGSLIIAFVVLIRWILMFIHGRLSGSSSAVAKFLLKCLACCLWCFEKVLKFINSNAYIEIAIHGYGFCKAARTAFMVIVSNALRLAAINCVGDFVLFLAKVAVVAVVAVVGLELFRDREEINYVWLPITLACVFAYFIASCFLGVYEMTIDAIFICFVEDCDMNDGISKPYFMSMGLMEYVSNSDDAKRLATQRRKGAEQF